MIVGTLEEDKPPPLLLSLLSMPGGCARSFRRLVTPLMNADCCQSIGTWDR